MKDKLHLSDIRKKFTQSMNRDSILFMKTPELIDPDSDIEIDFDVYLPTKGKNLQRPLVWSLIQKQQLILSILKGIKIPPVTVIQFKDDTVQSTVQGNFKRKYQIIDGKQRMNAMIEFMRGEFSIEVNEKNYFYADLCEEDYTKYEFDRHGVTGDIYYEYPDTLFTDDEKIALFEQINFSGTPQDVEHLKSLKS